MLKNQRNAIYVCSLPSVKIANNSIENVVKFKYFEKRVKIKIVFTKK